LALRCRDGWAGAKFGNKTYNMAGVPPCGLVEVRVVPQRVGVCGEEKKEGPRASKA